MLEKRSYIRAQPKKEQRKVLKFLEKELQKSIKKEARLAGMGKYAHYIYYKPKEFFVDGMYDAVLVEDKYKLEVIFCIKPYIYDNLFWEIFDMASNIQERDSLRAVGAFACPSLWVKVLLYDISLDTVEEVSARAVKEFKQEVELFIDDIHKNFGDFDSYIIQEERRHSIVLNMLAYIHMGRYAEAEAIAHSEISKGKHGGFENNGITIHEYILAHCIEKQLS